MSIQRGDLVVCPTGPRPVGGIVAWVTGDIAFVAWPPQMVLWAHPFADLQVTAEAHYAPVVEANKAPCSECGGSGMLLDASCYQCEGEGLAVAPPQKD